MKVISLPKTDLGECAERHQSKVAIGESVSAGGVQPCDVKRQLESGPKVAHSVHVRDRQTDQWFGRAVSVFGAECQCQMDDEHKVKQVGVNKVHRSRLLPRHLAIDQPIGEQTLNRTEYKQTGQEQLSMHTVTRQKEQQSGGQLPSPLDVA